MDLGRVRNSENGFESDPLFTNVSGLVGFRALPNTAERFYVAVAETVSAARDAGLSVCDYVEFLWNHKGQTA